jgi:hypothetical protein
MPIDPYPPPQIDAELRQPAHVSDLERRMQALERNAWGVGGVAVGEQNVTISAANTDLAAPVVSFWRVTTGGGSLRRIGLASNGTRVLIRNDSTAFSLVLAAATSSFTPASRSRSTRATCSRS